MSGASGKVPAAIHLTPEASEGGMIARLQDGDLLTLDAVTGELTVSLSDAELAERDAEIMTAAQTYGMGRELFQCFRASVSSAEMGGTVFNTNIKTSS